MNKETEISYEQIGEEIESIYKLDQDERMQGIASLETDEANSAKIKAIYEKIGFPTIQKVGTSASHRFVIVLLHSRDIEFKKRCLEDMRALSDDEVRKKDMAYLIDKIEVAETGIQVYGTQLFFNEEKDTYEVMEIQDPETVDERRLSLGLETLEKYLVIATESRREMMANRAK